MGGHWGDTAGPRHEALGLQEPPRALLLHGAGATQGPLIFPGLIGIGFLSKWASNLLITSPIHHPASIAWPGDQEAFLPCVTLPKGHESPRRWPQLSRLLSVRFRAPGCRGAQCRATASLRMHGGEMLLALHARKFVADVLIPTSCAKDLLPKASALFIISHSAFGSAHCEIRSSHNHLENKRAPLGQHSTHRRAPTLWV